MSILTNNRLMRKWNRGRLEAALVVLVDRAKDYNANGLPAGHENYKKIFFESAELIKQYCIKTGEDVDLVWRELPNLEKLKDLAVTPAPVSRTGSFVGWAIGAVAAFFVTGVFVGVAHWGYVLIFR